MLDSEQIKIGKKVRFRFLQHCGLFIWGRGELMPAYLEVYEGIIVGIPPCNREFGMPYAEIKKMDSDLTYLVPFSDILQIL